MPADETRLALEGEGAAVRKSPRHAAPRKTLLTKLHLPANKAMALAAMPTAVFVGMGLMPKPAVADDGEIPFSSGPCVTREDVAAAQEEEEQKASQAPSPSASEEEEKAADTEKSGTAEKPEAKPSEEPAPATEDAKYAGDAGSGDAAATTQKAAEEPAAQEPAPAASETTNPWDPLGVGEKLEQFGEDVKDFFTPDDKEEPAPEPAPTPSEQPAAEETEQPAAEKPTAEKPAAEDSSEDTSAKASGDSGAKASAKDADGAKGATDQLKADIEKAAEKAGVEVEALSADVPSLDEAIKDLPLGEDGKPRFPCAEENPAALAAADLEPGIPALPDYPWKLNTSMLTLRGLDYHGVVNVKTASGTVKPVLKFTATSVDIKDLHQTVQDPKGGPAAHIKGAKGSTSKIRNGTVTMYTELLKGNLFGLIPVEFTPETPPPLDVPYAMFTNVTVLNAGQFGGTLTIPGFENYVEQ
ncbi:hypothetical protein [Streptomyces sp. KLOTTS4A1]|uniref:hypothetical protein n=1 Tax=Streptomyces sp. KLOTTS4A1 TaxID=3390996 RepID=UPI0039F4E558